MQLVRKPAALEHRQFRLLFAAQTVSAIGDSLVPVALAFAVLGLTGLASDLGFVLAAGLVPRVLLVLAGGVWADRLPRQRVMLSADLLRGLTQTVLAIVLLTGEARVWHLLVLSALFGVGDAFFAPASTGLVPETVPASELQSANALRSLASHLSWTIGPGVSGAIVATAGAGWVFAIDAVTFAVSAAFLALMRVPSARAAAERRAFLAELRDGWSVLRSRTWLWASVLEFSVWNLAIAFVWVLGPLVAARSLHGASSWGLIATCGGLGSILGALVALRLRPRRPLLLLNVGCMGCCLLPFSLIAPQATAVIAATAVLCFGALAFANAVWESTLQRGVPRDALSRVSSYDWLGSLALYPLGMAIAGPVSDAIGVGPTLVVVGSVLASVAAAAVLVPSIRRLEAGAAPPAPTAPSSAGVPPADRAGAHTPP
jgi:MFS family permease